LEITVPAELSEDQRLGEISRVFQAMSHYAFNRLIEGKQHREVESILLERYGVENLLWRRNAIIQARGTMKSQQLLLSLHVEELHWKIQRVRRKLDRARNPLKRHGYEARIRKLQSKTMELEAHVKNGTLPKVVFSGRSGIGSEEWCLERRGQFLNVGDGWNKGPLKTHDKIEVFYPCCHHTGGGGRKYP
jgi:hypothetical protein